MSAAGPPQGARPPAGGGGAERRFGGQHTTDTLALATALGNALRARGWRAATAESCTGGLVAGAITDVAGSSEWFDRGFVTYSNEAKRNLLGVPGALIEEYGAVSEQIARAMAEGALAHSEAEVAVAITGVAGPGGGSPSKPVGMVCLGFVRRGEAAHAITRHYAGTRSEVRAAAVREALEGLTRIASSAA
jgi:nicotinamide-nucleotide amidase